MAMQTLEQKYKNERTLWENKQYLDNYLFDICR